MKIDSLKFKINAAILLTYIIVAVSFGAVFLRSQTKYGLKRFEEIEILLDAVFQQNRTNLANEIFTKNKEALLYSISEIKKVKDISHIYAYDDDGRLLLSDDNTGSDYLSESEAQDLVKKFSFYEMSKNGIPFAVYANGVKYLGECPGYVKIFYDLREFKKDLFLNKINFIAQLSVTFLILFGVLNLFLFKSVIRPASALRDAIKKVSEGSLGEKADITSRDEIGQMAGDFNKMSSMLQKQHKDLLASREMLQLVIDNIPQMIFWKDNGSIFLGCNKNFAKSININEPEDIINKKYEEIPWDKEMLASFQTIMKEAMDSDKPRLHIEKQFNLSGKDIYLDTSFIPLHNTEGEVVGILCTSEDITEKIKAKEDKKMLEIQLLHTSRLTAMGEMAAGIAHEINQPLAIINVAATGLIDNFFQKETDNIIYNSAKRIENQVNRASTIIDNMRSFVRVHSHPPEFIDIVKPINLGLSFFKEQFRIHGISLIVNLEENVPPVIADSQKFEQIVVNLLTNARYAVDEKANAVDSEYKKEVILNLSYNALSKLVVFEIIDNGIGMTPYETSRCIEPFYTTKEVGEGTGLGLSIVHNIVTEFKMKIEIESVKGKGSKFRILIPIREKKNEIRI